MIKRRKRPSLVVPTSSMGDIAFLLIIFFMLASNFMKSANVKSTDPESPDVEMQEASQVSVIYDADGRLWLQGVEIGIGELAAGVQQVVGDNKQTPVHVRIDKGHAGADFLPVIEALSDAGVRIMLAGGLQTEDE